jgi:hypothetical protein
MALKSYYGISLQLADTNPHALLPLLQAVDSTLNDILQNVGQLSIQADLGNGSNVVYVGDSLVSSTRRAYDLLAHDQTYHFKEAMNVPLGAIYVRASTANLIINVEVIP